MNVAMHDCLSGRGTHVDAEAHESANLQNRLMSFISSMEPATALAMRGSATTTARHWARETATLSRLWSRIKAIPR